MEKMPGKGVIAICCALAIALAALSAWDGVKQLNAAVTMHMSEQMVDVAGYASAYTRAYFKGLLGTVEGLALAQAQSGEALDAEALERITGELDAVAVEQFSCPNAQCDGISAEYGDGGTVLHVSAPIVRDGVPGGVLTATYDAVAVATELNRAFAEADYGFAVFMPDGRYVLQAANFALPSGGGSFYAIENASLAKGSSFDELLADIKAGRSGTLRCVSAGGESLMGYYTLLGINDWYIICVAPERAFAVLALECRSTLLVEVIKLVLIGALLAVALLTVRRRRQRALGKRTERLTLQLRKQRAALDTLGAPPFEFDLRALEAHPLDPDDRSCGWLMERILIPELAGEIVDPRDEAAYLKLCDAAMTTRGRLTGDFRLRSAPDAPLRMYRVTLSTPEPSGDTVSTVATLVDLDDVAGRMEQMRRRAAHDALTGLDTLSEFRLKAGALLCRPTHHFGALAFILIDNADAVRDSGGMTQEELLRMCADTVRGAMSECDVLARGIGGTFWIFSGDQTGMDIIQKGLTRLMNSEAGAEGVSLTFSCGISRADPDDGINDLIRRAYNAAQLAHRDGGRRVQHG